MAVKEISESALQLLTNAFSDYGSLGAEAIMSPRLFAQGFGNPDAAKEFARLREQRRSALPTYQPSEETIFAQEQFTKPITDYVSEQASMFAEENPNAAESIGDFFGDPRVSHTLGALELGLPSGARLGKAVMNRPDLTPNNPNKQKGIWTPYGDSGWKGLRDGGLNEELARQIEGSGMYLKRNPVFDERFDKRVTQQERLGNLEVAFDTPRRQIPERSIFEFEGEPFLLSMSDRTLEQGNMLGLKGSFFDEPVRTTGGQGFPFNPESIRKGHAWMSNEEPVKDIIRKGMALQNETGKNPLFLPHTMTPSGGDFSKLNGEILMKYAQKNMSPDTKKEFDQAIRDYKTVGSMKDGKRVNAGRQLENWKGIDDPESIKIWNAAPDVVRKEIKDKIFDKYRDKGGLSQGEARLALADPQQLLTPDGQLNTIARFDPRRGYEASGDATYDSAIFGEPIGRFKEDIESFDLLDQLYTSQGRKLNMQNPQRPDRRLLELQSYGGILTDDVLRRVEDRLKSR